MVPVVPALVVFVAQASTPRYFTNAENVRRIAAGKGFVAFATSGGVRVFERTSQKWRVYTQNDGLPNHNIHDVVFDRAKPNTLWVLCGAWGDWANEQPAPDLRLVTLDLANGKVEQVAPPTPAPRTARMGYHFFLDYRLSLSDGWAFVFTDKGAALAWDRVAKKWSREVSMEATPPRPSHYPGHAESIQLVGSSDSMLAFFVQTKATFINQSNVIPTNKGEGAVITNRQKHIDDKPVPYVLLYNRQTKHVSRHPLGDSLLDRNADIFVGSNGKLSSILNYGSPQKFLLDSHTDEIVIVSINNQMIVGSEEGHELNTYQIVRHRVAPNLKEPVLISQEKITVDQMSQVQQTAQIPLVHWTDFLVEGDTLWLTGYNDLSYPPSSGIARLDLTTGKWESFAPSVTGIAANFSGLDLIEKGVISFSGPTLRRYDPKVNDFTLLPPQGLTENPFLYNTLIPEPRAALTNEDGLFGEWVPFRVLGREGNRALVVGPPTPTPTFTRDASGRVTGPGKRSGPDVLFSFEVATRKLTKLEMRGLEDLQPRAAGFGESALFFLTEERTPGERRGAPIVLRWDTKTGSVKRYPESLFREVSVAAQRTAGVRQQVDLKKRQTQRNEQLRRFPGAQLPPVELRPVQEFLRPLRGSFLKAAGTSWLRLDQHLFRYDASRDTWATEGLADSLSPEGETALWKQAGPELWRFEGDEARRLRGEVSRWSAATGWQKLELGESARQAGNSVLFHDGALWLSGVGALRLPQSAWIFRKVP